MTPALHRSEWVRYASAVIFTVAATWGRLALTPLVGDTLPFLFFFPAVMASAWLGGLGPGVLSTLLAMAASAYFFMPPTPSFAVSATADLVGLVTFSLIGGAISAAFEGRRNFHREMRESRERLLLIGNALPVLVSLIGKDLRYQFVNGAYTTWFGISREKAIGRTLAEVLGISAFSIIEPYLTRALAGETVNFEARLPYASGGERDVRVTYTPYFRGDEVVGIVALVVDVSERVKFAQERDLLLEREREARRAAQHGEERLRFLVENSPYAVAMLDREMRYLFASGQWLADFRLTLTNEEIRGRSHYEIFPEIPDNWKEIHRRCLQGETANNAAEPFARVDGSIDWIRWEIRPWCDQQGQVGGILIFSEDIGPEKRSAEERRRWEHVFQNAAWGMSLATPDNRFTVVNRAFAKMHGTEPEEWVGRPLLDMFAEESKAALPELTRQVHESGHAQYESIHVRKDGSKFPVLTEVSAFRDERGGLVFRAGNYLDITSRKEAEVEFRRTKDWLELVMNGIADGFMVFDQDFRIVYIGHVDVARLKAAGIEARALLGKELWAEFPALLGTNNETKLREAMEKRIPTVFETKLGERWYEVRAYPTSDGGLSVLSPDITDRKVNDLALKESEERFRAIADDSPVMIWVDREDGSIDFVNRACSTFFGPELATWGWTPFIHPDDCDAYVSGYRKAMRTRSAFRAQARVRRADGKWRWIQSYGLPRFSSSGKFLGMIGSSPDITEQKEAEVTLQSAVQLRDDFLSIASHELRTPLTSLQLQLDGIQRLFERDAGNGSQEKLTRKVSMAVRQSDRLTALIDGLLNVSRIQQGRFRLQLEELDVAELVREVIERFEEQAARSGSKIALHAPKGLLSIWDRTRIDQVITNLISNAVKYGAEKAIDITVTSDVDSVYVAVQDEGIGIKEADLERIFSRFERAVSSENYGGLGLGLYIANQIVRAHGGRVRVMSQPGKGSTFTVVLPMRASEDTGALEAMRA